MGILRKCGNDEIVYVGIEPDELISYEDFESVLICALRYCIGRRTYMPSIVVGYIRKFLPMLSYRTLGVMRRDIEEAQTYGDEQIDKPLWMAFLEDVKTEQDKRDMSY